MKSLKVAVLGPIPRDHITTHHGEVIQKYGAATHTAIALSRLMNNTDQIIPVTHVRKQDYQGVLKVLAPYKNINTDFISNEHDQGDVIQLTFVDQNNRLEKQTAFMPPITPEDMKDLMDCDVFVCVPVTDFEVPLATLQYIKANSDGVIVFDAHGPTTALTHRGDRITKFWADRDMWLPFIDVLKMNLEEANCSWFKNEYELGELAEHDAMSEDLLPEFATHCLKAGLNALYVTLDSRGVMVYTWVDGKLVQEHVPPVIVDHVVDTTGCGDSFAGGVAFGLLDNKTNYISAANYGNAMGAQRTQGKSFEVFKSKAETDAMIVAGHISGVK